MKYILLWCVLIAAYTPIDAQDEHDEEDLMVHVFGAYNTDTIPLIGANVYWANTTVGASANERGIAMLPQRDGGREIVASYIGFYNDTTVIYNESKRHYYVFLVNEEMLDAVEIVRRKRSQDISIIEPVNTIMIGENELKKAACCDLSESFTTNAAVDVSYSDAVTGSREIRLLGLDGKYVEMLNENVPSIRGLAIPFGMTYVPGPWISNIHISKGAGTIRSSHESMTGAINYSLHRPLETDPLYIDLFANHRGRYEANLVTAWDVNERLGTVFAVNAGGLPARWDSNEDGFMDQPLYNRYNIMNRWSAFGDKAETQFYISYLHDDRTSGQMDFDPEIHKGGQTVYGLGLRTNRIDASHKVGIFFDNQPNMNIGWTNSVSYHNSTGYFGTDDYSGDQLFYNSNMLFQSIIKTTDHNIIVGANFHYDKYDESFQSLEFNDRFWNVGALVEYTYTHTDKLTVVAGMRLDQHSEYGTQFSPRLHMRWSPHVLSAIRISAGRGFRAPRLLGENISLMASSREFVLDEPVGLEASWNTGLGMVQKFNLANRSGYFSADYYFTSFTDQAIYDVEQSDNRVHFYNLDGRSFAHSFQVEVAYEVAPGLDLKAAYKFDEVKETLTDGLALKAFIYRHKGLLTASYISPNSLWQVDMSANLHGKHRLPASFEGVSTGGFSPIFVLLNMQVSKFFENGIEIYAGVENLANYTQEEPIVGSDDPFGNNFDTAQAWGPVVGAKGYFGFRYKLAKK